MEYQISTNSWMFYQAHGLLLWRRMRNQVYQDDIGERKGEKEKDIGVLT